MKGFRNDSEYMQQNLSEILLTRLEGRWTELESHRHGIIDLKSTVLSDEMQKMIHPDELKLDAELVSSTSMQLQRSRKKGSLTFNALAGESLVLRVSLLNQSERSVQPRLTLEPHLEDSSSDQDDEIGRAIIWDGLLQKVGPVIHPGETQKVEWVVGFVCPGRYEILLFAESYRVGDITHGLIRLGI